MDSNGIIDNISVSGASYTYMGMCVSIDPGYKNSGLSVIVAYKEALLNPLDIISREPKWLVFPIIRTTCTHKQPELKRVTSKLVLPKILSDYDSILNPFKNIKSGLIFCSIEEQYDPVKKVGKRNINYQIAKHLKEWLSQYFNFVTADAKLSACNSKLFDMYLKKKLKRIQRKELCYDLSHLLNAEYSRFIPENYISHLSQVRSHDEADSESQGIYHIIKELNINVTSSPQLTSFYKIIRNEMDEKYNFSDNYIEKKQQRKVLNYKADKATSTKKSAKRKRASTPKEITETYKKIKILE